ncbi:TldD protein, part of TldE/TldD proteolytic complex [hydrothermal vent metagenome]|uniref:TldD protein, part of TldE/TldD proteolytic complex n=1 Tax=hydrothermal vent metagenome TaxID=652676 RepID=A0A3B0UPG6_9ZZZZ
MLKQVKKQLLEAGDLDESKLDAALSQSLATGADFADLYFQSSRMESWTLEDTKVKSGSHSIDRGVGVRINSGEKTGFAYADALTNEGMMQAVKTARTIANTSTRHQPVKIKVSEYPSYYTPLDVLTEVTNAQIIALLNKMDVMARKLDPRINKVICSLVTSQEYILVAATDGTYAADIRPMTKLSIQVIAGDNKGRMEIGFAGGGGRMTLGELFKQGVAATYVKQAVNSALTNLQAVAAPAGIMPVVLGAGWPGVLLHEAIGHGLEGDFNRKGTSAFTGKIGQRVASEQCTIIDSGILPNRRGSINIDDEGTPAAENVLIEKGILKGYMQDKLNARLMGVKPTGNGRRESFAHLPMPRMTNTYMLNGKYAHEEIIASVKKGIYAENFRGGQVDITNGKFVFSASDAFLIENGKITKPVKGVTLIGDGPTVLTKVSMVANNLAFDQGMGVCGKDGQSIAVGIGQPTLKVDELTVGGTEF